MIRATSYCIVGAQRAAEPAKKRKTTKKVAPPSHEGFRLTDCNNEVLMNIMDQLSITDNACLALTCKFLAAVVTRHNQFAIKASTAVCSHIRDPTLPAWHLEVTEFFKRLQKGWVPRTGPDSLRLCLRCSKFRPRTDEYWMVSPLSFEI